MRKGWEGREKGKGEERKKKKGERREGGESRREGGMEVRYYVERRKRYTSTHPHTTHTHTTVHRKMLKIIRIKFFCGVKFSPFRSICKKILWKNTWSVPSSRKPDPLPQVWLARLLYCQASKIARPRSSA